MGRLLFVTAAAVALCGAQNLPSLMQRAVHSLAEKQSRWRMPESVSLADRPSEPSSKTCSVPLLEMRVDHPERFTMKITPADPSTDKAMRILPSAPACGSGQAKSNVAR